MVAPWKSGTIKDRIRVIINGTPRLAEEVVSRLWPLHDHGDHTGLEDDDHPQYVPRTAGLARSFTGDVYFNPGIVLRGVGDLRLDDHWRSLSAFPTPGIDLSDSAVTWTNWVSRFGNVSLMAGINTAIDTALSGVRSIHVSGQTAYGGDWRFLSGSNISIVQGLSGGIHTITINGQSGGGSYDDSACFYHDGSRLATGDFDLNDHAIENVNALLFDVSPAVPVTRAEGQLWIDPIDGYLMFGSKGPVFNHPLGAALAHRMRWDEVSSPAIGRVVRVSGYTGETAKCKLASYDTFYDALSFGVITDIEPGDQHVWVVSSGRVNCDTSTFTEGAAVWLGEAGVLSETRPEAPLISVFIGYVTKSDASGFLCVRPTFVPRLSMLSDVLHGTPPADGDVPMWNAEEGHERFEWATSLGATLEEHAIGYGSAEDRLTGDVDLLSFDAATSLLLLGSTAPSYITGAGACLNGDLEVTGNSFFADSTWMPVGACAYFGGTLAEPKASVTWKQVVSPSVVNFMLLESSEKMYFKDSGGRLRLSAGIEQDWTDLSNNFLSNDLVLILNELSGRVKSLSANGGDALTGALDLVAGTNCIISPLTDSTGFRFDAVVSLQNAYDGGNSISLGIGKGPVAIASSSAAYGSLLTLDQTDADTTAPLLDITNDSDSGAMSIYLQGDAGAERNYGHRIWASDAGGVLSFGRTYESGDFDGEVLLQFSNRLTNPYTHIQDAALLARVDSESAASAYVRVSLSPIDSTPSGYNGLVTLAGDSINVLSGGDISILADGSVDVQGARSVSYGSAPTAITYGTTIEANFATGTAFQECTATGNITTVTLTAPPGVQVCQLQVTASGGARSITGFSGSVSWGEPIDPDSAALTIPSGEWAIFWLCWNGSGWNGTVIRKFS